MIYIAFHLHAYLPPTASEDSLNKFYTESFEPLIVLAEANLAIYFSLDIARSVGERLPPQFLDRIQKLYMSQRIELVNTAAYHYLLPLVPPEIALRQLALNLEFYRDAFTKHDPITGVFLPELAYASHLSDILYKSGYQWLLMDDALLAQKNAHIVAEERVPNDLFFMSPHECASVLRSRMWSERIREGDYKDGAYFAGELIKEQRVWNVTRRNFTDSYIILTLDLAAFNCQKPNKLLTRFLPAFFNEIVRQKTVCEISFFDFLISHFPKSAPPQPLPASSGASEIIPVPFPLWNHPKNIFHRTWNELIACIFNLTSDLPNAELQFYLDRFAFSTAASDYSHGNMHTVHQFLLYVERIARLLPEEKRIQKLVTLYQIITDLVK